MGSFLTLAVLGVAWFLAYKAESKISLTVLAVAWTLVLATTSYGSGSGENISQLIQGLLPFNVR